MDAEVRMKTLWSEYPDIKKELESVEEFILKNISSRNKLLNKIAQDLVAAGGKRLRPAFVVIAAKFGNYDRDKVISMAGALEILHTATLVHDDVIDRSKLRRGRETVSEQYGIDMAVYTGDFLFTKAILMLSKDIPIDHLDAVAAAIKSICEGEVDQYQDRYNADTTILTYLKRVKRKTAILFGAACGIGAQIAECPREVSSKLAKFGLYYGTAFQIRDDINDFVSSENSSGKPVEKDLVEGVVTLPVIYAMNKNRSIKNRIEKVLQKKYSVTSRDAMEVCRLVRDYKGVEEAKELMDKYIDKSMKILKSLPDNEYNRMLADIAERLRMKRED